MQITTDLVKELRDLTGISVMQCKKALEEADGNKEKALVLLRKKGASVAAKKADRELKAGTVASYVHAGGTIGAMVVLSCETDFVSGNEEFKTLARDLAMQVAATAPEYASLEAIPEEAKQAAREVFEKEVKDKPKEMQGKILEGKLASYFKEKTLLDQPFIKDESTTVEELVKQVIAKTGENIRVDEFRRLTL